MNSAAKLFWPSANEGHLLTIKAEPVDEPARERSARFARLHPMIQAYRANLTLEQREALNFVYPGDGKRA